MKRMVIIYLVCIIGLFFLPVFMIKEYKKEEKTEEIEISKIRLFLSKTGKVVEMSLDEYIMGVLVGEMPVSYELEALKAQAVVARTYTLNKILNAKGSHENADMCDDINHCQAYQTKEYALSCWEDHEELEKWNKIKKAVQDTSNEVIVYDGNLINAFFHANSGGMTEDISNIWGHEKIPYLRSVEGKEEEPLLEKVTLSYSEIDRIMKENYLNYSTISEKNQLNWNAEKLTDFVQIVEKNSSDRVAKLKVSNIILEGTEARSLFSLRSTLFDVRLEQENVIFETKGYGHGVGLSQVGANGMALKGATYEEIIKHYYTGVEIRKMVKQ